MSTTTPTLEVGPWRLRPLQLSDAAPWLAILRDAEVRRLTSWSIDDLEALQGLLRDYIEGPRAQTSRKFAVVDEAGAFAGTVGFKDWDRAARTAELTYELAPALRGRGAATALGRAVLDHGAREMQLDVVSAVVNVENAASRRVLEKLGFTPTATLPAFRVCGGVLRDFVRLLLRVGERG